MIKQKLIELVQYSSQMVVSNTDYSFQLIDAYMSTIYAELVSSAFERSDNTRFFTKDYTLPVVLDATKNVYYSLYPTDVVYVNDAAGPARFISPSQDRSLVFIPINDEDYELSQNLNCNLLDLKIKYIAGRDRIEYHNIPADLVAAGVLSRIAVSWDSYLYTDNIYMPNDIQKTFVEQAVMYFNGSTGIRSEEIKKER